MEHRISAEELATKLGDILGRICSRGDSFIVERDGDPVACLVPLPEKTIPSLREGLAAWRAAREPEPAFADDLERVGAADRPPDDVWAS